MNVYLDIETIPNPQNYEAYLEDALANFKAPSGLTKTQACKDLGLTGNDAKFTPASDVIMMWEREFAKEKAPEVAELNFRKESFNGAKGQVVSIAWAVGDDEIESACQNDSASELNVLSDFFEYMSSMKKSFTPYAPYFIGHYIGGFDLKFLFHRAVVNKIKPPMSLPFSGRHGSDYFCTMQAWAGYRDSISLDDLCSALGMEGKGDIDGSMVWDLYKEGRYQDIEEYNRDDVKKVRDVHKRLTFV